MVKFSFGRFAAPFEPLVSLLFGGGNSLIADVVVVARAGCDVADLDNWDEPPGCDTARGGGLISGEYLWSSLLGVSDPPKKTRAKTEPPSSMGVNILCDFEAACLRSGGDGGLKFVCSG